MGQKNCKPQPGDLIEIFRQGYQHWALYVGDGYVIHLTVDGASLRLFSGSSSSGARAKVKKELLKDVVGNHRWRVNKMHDYYRTPFPVEEIIRCAEQWIDREVPYNVLNSNCEHFVTMLRYGEPLCKQVRNAVVNSETLAGLAILVAAAIPLVDVALATGICAVAVIAGAGPGGSAIFRMAFSGRKSKRSHH